MRRFLAALEMTGKEAYRRNILPLYFPHPQENWIKTTRSNVRRPKKIFRYAPTVLILEPADPLTHIRQYKKDQITYQLKAVIIPRAESYGSMATTIHMVHQ